jgi:glycosyltransferase involved in cell wall biosynthesis
MRILLLNDRIPPENRGGAGEVVWRLAIALKNEEHDVHVVAATEGTTFSEIRDNIPTYHLHVNYPQRLRSWFSLYNPQVNQALRNLYRKIQPDVVNAHNIHADLTYYSLTIAHKMAIPTVFSSHDVMPFAYQKLSHFIDHQNCKSSNDYRLPSFYNLKQMRLHYNPFRNMSIRYILRHHTQIRTAPSHELCKAHQANGLPTFTCVHNGIDTESFRASSQVIENLRRRLGLAAHKIVLFAGRLTGAKGTHFLLKALRQIVEDIPETRLLLLSSVPLEEQLSRKRLESVQHFIKLGGWLAGEELAAAFHLADIVTVPSVIFDTFPTVNLEAMATKTPVIATCFGGSHEAVIDDETGYLINPFDSDIFADRLRTLLSDDTLREKMGQAGYERVTSQFTMQKQVEQMLTIYQEAIES